MQNFTPWSATLGGLLIGLASAGILLSQRRSAGVSGIVGGLVLARAGQLGLPAGDRSWRWLFSLGLVLGGALGLWVAPQRFSFAGTPGLAALAVSGLLVGFGTRLGGGCTSGHGVCGLGRFSPRSLVAVLTFMLTAALVVFVTKHVLGGS